MENKSTLQLKQYCRKNGIHGYSNLRKTDLIALINKHKQQPQNNLTALVKNQQSIINKLLTIVPNDKLVKLYDDEELRHDVVKTLRTKNIKWKKVSAYPNLSEDFIREFENELDWSEMSYNQKFTETFIREFSHKVDWHGIGCSQKISEDFIREFKDKEFNWLHFIKYQKVSEDFIREFQDKYI